MWQAQQRQIREYKVAAETRINETQNKISEETQRLADISGGSYVRQQEKFEQAQSEAEEARKRNEELLQDANCLHRDVEEATTALKSAETPLSRKKADVQQAENFLQNLTREGGPRNSGYHERLPMLLKAIQQEKSFTQTPVGPVGHHVSLLQPKWSSILETSFGTTLNSFIVTSKKDMNILSSIMKRAGW